MSVPRARGPPSIWSPGLQGLGLPISYPASMTPSSVPQGRQVDADTKAGRKGKELDDLVPETAKGKPELVGGVQTPLGCLFAPSLGGPCLGRRGKRRAGELQQ
jgi:hypothetical protein